MKRDFLKFVFGMMFAAAMFFCSSVTVLAAEIGDAGFYYAYLSNQGNMHAMIAVKNDKYPNPTVEIRNRNQGPVQKSIPAQKLFDQDPMDKKFSVYKSVILADDVKGHFGEQVFCLYVNGQYITSFSPRLGSDVFLGKSWMSSIYKGGQHQVYVQFGSSDTKNMKVLYFDKNKMPLGEISALASGPIPGNLHAYTIPDYPGSAYFIVKATIKNIQVTDNNFGRYYAFALSLSGKGESIVSTPRPQPPETAVPTAAIDPATLPPSTKSPFDNPFQNSGNTDNSESDTQSSVGISTGVSKKESAQKADSSFNPFEASGNPDMTKADTSSVATPIPEISYVPSTSKTAPSVQSQYSPLLILGMIVLCAGVGVLVFPKRKRSTGPAGF